MNNTRYVNNCYGIIVNDENGIIDKFYEESEATWRAIIHFAFHLMIIVKIIYRIIY